MAAAVITSMLSVTMAGNVLAGPPTIATDEALYVNLDYYGKQVDSSVVKGVTLNGLRSFTDYGKYNDVTNMSNYASPMIEKGGVSWKLPEDVKERFYYECQLNNKEVALPWDFDVSYKLNGTPKKAQELLHADGLVEMDIHCIPNENAKAYYKNNMLLQVVSMVDMEDVSSVEAPGSQTQSLGTYKVVLFAAVPGEEKTFHIEISSHDFESNGIIMLMVPGTLDQISEIADIKEVKETFEDSTDELVDGMNEMLDTLHNISNGMTVAQKGLQQLQRARKNFDASKDEIINNADGSINSLETINAKLTLLAPDIQANKQALDELNGKVNTLVETLQDSGDDFYDLSSSLRDLKDNLGDLQDNVEQSDVDGVKEEILEIEKQLAEIEKTLNTISAASKSQLTQAELDQQADDMKDLADSLGEVLNSLAPFVGRDQLENYQKELTSISLGVSSDPASLLQASATMSKIVNSLQSILSSVRGVLSSIDLDDGISNGKSISRELASIMDNIDTTIGDVASLNKTKNDNKAAFDTMLDDTSASLQEISNGSNQLVSLLRSVQNTVKKNRKDVENGTKDTLDGLIDIFEKTAKTSGTTDKLKEANESLHDSVKHEIDKIGDDTNILNMDSEEDMVSFTSDKNPAPSSIQIVLRTEEISEDDVNDNAVDIEPQAVDVGVWQRVKNVFVEIWDGITGLFS